MRKPTKTQKLIIHDLLFNYFGAFSAWPVRVTRHLYTIKHTAWIFGLDLAIPTSVTINFTY